ncbi:MAG: 4'-phosphopantetheinyl transferase superfamily protein [Flavobacteriaceae bacterium]|nr:4'-phosphopantetheinyl transferase superfamily protein [Flavobacteriaceae bacterium]
MPLDKELDFKFKTRVILWKIEETEDELLKSLTLPLIEKEKLKKRKNLKHRLGFLGSRAGLISLEIDLDKVLFNANGAPFLNDHRYCSISHTDGYSAVAVSDNKIGVDVEIYKDKITRIASKFVHPAEVFVNKSENYLKMLTRLWTVKESVYKAFGVPGIHFSKAIQVDPFRLQDQQGTARLVHLKTEYFFKLYFRTITNGELCIAIQTI